MSAQLLEGEELVGSKIREYICEDAFGLTTDIQKGGIEAKVNEKHGEDC
jgi:hypothetical protein